MAKMRDNERSTFTSPGPVTTLRPALPKVLVGRSEKQAVLNHWSGVLGPSFGLQPATAFGRSKFCSVPLMLPLSPGVKGRPIWMLTMLANCQPLMSRSLRLLPPRDTVQIGLQTNLWRTSKSESPRIVPLRFLLSGGVAPEESEVEDGPGFSSIDLPYVYDIRKENPWLR